MDLRQKRDIRRLGRQIIQIIFFLWMPALYTSAFCLEDSSADMPVHLEPWEMECMHFQNGFRKK